MKWSISAANKAELLHKFESVGTTVPPRTGRRDKDAEETFSLRRLILPLAWAGSLLYPLLITRDESPDFDFRWPDDSVSGLEITIATKQHLQEDWTHLDKAEETRFYPSSEGAMSLSENEAGWTGDSAAQEWATYLLAAVERKADLVPSYTRVSICDVLIYDDMPTQLVIDLPHAVKLLRSQLSQSAARNSVKSFLRTISVVSGASLVHDIEGAQIFLTYKPEWG